LAAPQLEHVADLSISVAVPIDVGDTLLGRRRMVPILSGTVRGRLSGRVLPGGADVQLINSPSLTTMQARYIIESERGDLVYVENIGMRVADPELMARLNHGEAIDPARIYFRTTPRFETAAPELAWLMSSLFIASGARYPDRVELSVFRVA
jgi:hypothetical protein